MKYFSREEVERTGRRGSYWEIEDGLPKARVLDSFWLYCDPDDLGFTPHMTTMGDGFWESWITKWMSQNVEPGSKCIDIGANHGYYSMFLAHHDCDVIAVEPQIKLSQLIEKSAEKNKFSVTVSQYVISDEPGTVKMIVPSGHGMNASVAYIPPAPNGYEEISAKAIILDEVGAGYDFIKVDVEGSEDKVFHGAYRFITRNPNCVWLLEFNWERLKNPWLFAEDLFDKMHVSYVDYYGNEIDLSRAEQLATRQNEDWMLVLRRKK